MITPEEMSKINDDVLRYRLLGTTAEMKALTQDFADDRQNENLDEESKEILTMVDARINHLSKVRIQLKDEIKRRNLTEFEEYTGDY